jgi:copper chaperone NosL
MWRIDLVAPQYPEGLYMKIYPNKLGGNVEIINGLNHYIGMKKIIEEDFIEFKVLPYIIGALSLFGLIVFFTRKKWLFYTWTIVYILFGILAMYDFYRWEYDYGHNLDPTAAIIVPGMSYQPPLIGYKQLLNFGAYSFPDVGGYIFIVVGLLLLAGIYIEWRKSKKTALSISSVLILCMMLMIQSCSTGPKPIVFGKDECSFCKMIISDQRFGAELITEKNKIYKFDDTHCIVSFLKSKFIAENDIKAVYLIDYSNPGELINSKNCYILLSEELRSPMGGNGAAFASEDSIKKYTELMKGTNTKWSDLIK